MLKQLDLGIGNTNRAEEGYELFGVDVVSNMPNVKIADLALEPIPYPDNEFDLVTAYDFMEHVPYQIYLPETTEKGWVKNPLKMKRRDCMIELFNQIYRVLKSGGIFYMQSPVYPNRQAFQDPGHVYYWTEETPNYFSGDYYGFSLHYGHTSRFEKLEQNLVGAHLHLKLRARKDLPEDYPYILNYPPMI